MFWSEVGVGACVVVGLGLLLGVLLLNLVLFGAIPEPDTLGACGEGEHGASKGNEEDWTDGLCGCLQIWHVVHGVDSVHSPWYEGIHVVCWADGLRPARSVCGGGSLRGPGCDQYPAIAKCLITGFIGRVGIET